MGRALPYGEGVTYWPLGEMVKAAAGISDDDPLEEAFEKLRECCAEEAVADVLGLAAGLMEALEGERSPQEIAWAAREVMQGIADVQPLILLFEDIHWAEAPLLDLIEHLADWVRAPLLILCLARPELLDARPGWGGGRVRSTAIELEPLSEEESARARRAAPQPARGRRRRATRRRSRRRRSTVPRATRCSSRRRSACSSRAAPATARPIASRTRCRRSSRPASTTSHLTRRRCSSADRSSGASSGGARSSTCRPTSTDHEALLDDLLQREFLLREPRSSISGETAYRFKHALIREVAYTGMAKLARAQYHARFAEWLAERTGEELVEIRAYHLDQAVEFLTELEGAPPEELAQETAGALVKAAKRAIAREAYANARTLGLRALELRPTLGARYVAARAAWRLQDFARGPGRDGEGARPGARARRAASSRRSRSRRSARRRSSATAMPARAQELVDEALEILAERGRPGRPLRRAHGARDRSAPGAVDVRTSSRYMERAYVIAIDAGRKDLQTIAAQVLAQTHIVRLELDEAELLLTRALELAGESGSVRARVECDARRTAGSSTVKGELDAARDDVRGGAADGGRARHRARRSRPRSLKLGWRRACEAATTSAPRSSSARRCASRRRRGDRGLAARPPGVARDDARRRSGKIDEAERLALEAAGERAYPRTRSFRGHRVDGARRRSGLRRGATTRPRSSIRSALDRRERVGLRDRSSSHPLERLVGFLPRPRARRRSGGLRGAASPSSLPAEPSSTERIA